MRNNSYYRCTTHQTRVRTRLIALFFYFFVISSSCSDGLVWPGRLGIFPCPAFIITNYSSYTLSLLMLHYIATTTTPSDPIPIPSHSLTIHPSPTASYSYAGEMHFGPFWEWTARDETRLC